MILWQCCKENIFISVYTKYRNKNIVVGMFQEKNVSGKCCSNVFTTLSQCWQRFYNVFTTFWQLFMERNVVTTFFRVDKSTLWQRFTMFLAMLLKCCENVFWGGQVNVVAMLHNVSCNVAKML